MTEFVVSNISFLDSGVEITFMRYPDDVRNDGRLIATRSYSLAEDHPSYEDEIRELRELATDLVRDVYDDFDDAPVIAPAPEAGEDEDRGMGE